MTISEITNSAYYHAIRIMFSEKSPTEGMRDLDSFVRKLILHPIWEKIQSIRFQDELPILLEWAEITLQSHPGNFPILYFCLSDMGDIMSLIFLQQIREVQSQRDWEAYSNKVYSDAPSHVLQQMYDIAETELSDGKGGYTNSEVRWIVETCCPLAYAGSVVGEIMKRVPRNVLLGGDSTRRVAVFFGEGDDFFFGEVTNSGFKYYEAPDFVS
jgi:hypothetical protein